MLKSKPKQANKEFYLITLLVFVATAQLGCTPKTSTDSASAGTTTSTQLVSHTANRLSEDDEDTNYAPEISIGLYNDNTDTPYFRFGPPSSVVVNITQIQLDMIYMGEEFWVTVDYNVGNVDLIQLNQTISQVTSFFTAEGVTVSQASLVLDPNSGYAILPNGSTCALQLPSIINNSITVPFTPIVTAGGMVYAINLDVDALSSIFIYHGNCMLVPQVTAVVN